MNQLIRLKPDLPIILSLQEIIEQVRKLNSRIQILVRTEYFNKQEELSVCGADAIFSDEGEVALSMAEFILMHFGATPEQVDRERNRVHETLICSQTPLKKSDNGSFFNRFF